MSNPFPSPFSRKAILDKFFSLLETPDAPSEIMEEWQSLGVLLLLWPLLEKVFEEGDRRRIPPAAFLVTRTPSEGYIAYNESIQVRAALAYGISEDMGFEALWSRYQEINDVAPLTPYVAYVLYVHRRLFAWDVRSTLPMFAQLPEVHRRLGLFSHGPQEARNHRRAAFGSLPPNERAEVVRDALTSDIFESGRKRVPLKGMLVNGGVTILDSGDVVDPFRFLRFFDTALGIGRTIPTPASALSEQDQRLYDALPASEPQSFSEDDEDAIQEVTASLPRAEKMAVQHYLRAKFLKIELKAYCKQYSLPYKSLHKAAKRGIDRLRKQS